MELAVSLSVSYANSIFRGIFVAYSKVIMSEYGVIDFTSFNRVLEIVRQAFVSSRSPKTQFPAAGRFDFSERDLDVYRNLPCQDRITRSGLTITVK